jgi:hypothetical protein
MPPRTSRWRLEFAGRTCGIALAIASLAAPALGTGPGRAIVALEAPAAGRFAALALACVHQEYPNKISHVLAGDGDARPPRELTPAFYGCYDWHSSVHGHWLLARAAHLFPGSPFEASARAALERSLTSQNVAVELTYMRGSGRTSFERPYGLAWLLQLGTELRTWDDPQARRWGAALAPLEAEAAARIVAWLPKLRYPIRVGEHGQTAFAFGLIHDWARTSGDAAMLALLRAKASEFYLGDRSCPLAYEPSGEDFLSPCLAEADFMRRVLAPREFARWLDAFLPGIPRRSAPRAGARGARPWLEPGIVTDRSDPKLAHIDGLNLSRAWMLEGIASGLPSRDPRIPALRESASLHAESALHAVTGEHYEGGHWLGSFALYLTSGAGLGPAAAPVW